MRIGDRVTRKDSPAIVGTLIARDGEKVKIYWSCHTSQWIDPRKLMRAGKTPREART